MPKIHWQLIHALFVKLISIHRSTWTTAAVATKIETRKVRQERRLRQAHLCRRRSCRLCSRTVFLLIPLIYKDSNKILNALIYLFRPEFTIMATIPFSFISKYSVNKFEKRVTDRIILICFKDYIIYIYRDKNFKQSVHK